MANILSFEVPQVASPKSRMTQSDRWIERPTVARYREFVDAVRAAAIDAKRAAGLPDGFIFDGPVGVEFIFKPDRTIVQVWPVDAPPRGKRAGDLDNFVKAVFEGLMHQSRGLESLVPILIEDDSQVVILNARIEGT